MIDSTTVETVEKGISLGQVAITAVISFVTFLIGVFSKKKK